MPVWVGHVLMIFVLFHSSPARCWGILFGARHRTREQTTSERHPREPAFSHQRWTSATLSSTPYTSYPFIPRSILFQGAFFHAHFFKPATRHPEIPPVCWWVWKIQGRKNKINEKYIYLIWFTFITFRNTPHSAKPDSAAVHDSLGWWTFCSTCRLHSHPWLWCQEEVSPAGGRIFTMCLAATHAIYFCHLHRYFRQELERLDEGLRKEDMAVHVRRDHVFEDSYRELHRKSPEDMKNRL